MRVKLQRTREAYGFSQQQFADAVGISRSHYSQIETGDKNPSFDLARKIKSVLNYPGDDLFDEQPLIGRKP